MDSIDNPMHSSWARHEKRQELDAALAKYHVDIRAWETEELADFFRECWKEDSEQPLRSLYLQILACRNHLCVIMKELYAMSSDGIRFAITSNSARSQEIFLNNVQENIVSNALIEQRRIRKLVKRTMLLPIEERIVSMMAEVDFLFEQSKILLTHPFSNPGLQ